MTDLEWEQDFLPWMGEQITLAWVPLPPNKPIYAQKTPHNSTGTWILLLNTRNRPQAQKIWKKLDRLVADRHNFKIEFMQKSGQSFIQWTSPIQNMILTRGWIEKDTLLITLGSFVTPQLIPQPSLNLNSNEAFKKVILTGINPNQGQLFLNVKPFLNANVIQSISFSENQKILLNAIETIGFTISTAC